MGDDGFYGGTVTVKYKIIMGLRARVTRVTMNSYKGEKGKKREE